MQPRHSCRGSFFVPFQTSDDEPALWLKDYGGEIRLWIEVGLPDERLLRRAAGRNMELQCTIQDGQVWITDGPATAAIELRALVAS